MSKRYPIKLAKVCSLFIVLLGILIPSLYIYVGADGLTVIDVVIASVLAYPCSVCHLCLSVYNIFV